MQARPLTEADLPRAVALSTLVGWNQTAADWRAFLEGGAVRALDDDHPDCLAATAAVLPFGRDLAWISMVLVRPDRRREGLATRLMRWAVEHLHGTRCAALDATPAGREVYRGLGFADAFGFARWRLDGPLRAPPVPVRPVLEADWPSLLARDAEAFGAPRGALLRGSRGARRYRHGSRRMGRVSCSAATACVHRRSGRWSRPMAPPRPPWWPPRSARPAGRC